jgi:hypothetical protein
MEPGLLTLLAVRSTHWRRRSVAAKVARRAATATKVFVDGDKCVVHVAQKNTELVSYQQLERMSERSGHREGILLIRSREGCT